MRLTVDNPRYAAKLTLLAAVLLTPGILPAQRFIDPERPGNMRLISTIDELMSSPGGEQLSCSVRKLDPVLNFAFRYQAGYQVTIPLRQFPADGVRIRVFARIRSQEGRTFYFSQNEWLPDGPREKNLQVTLTGGFFVGEGVYEADLLTRDSLGRACSEQWKFRLRLKGDERRTARFVPAGTLAPLEMEAWKGASEGRPYRVSVILHVAPILPSRARVSQFDQSLLATTLSALFEETPFREVSVRAISLQQQSEIFSSGPLDASGFRRLLEVMDGVQTTTIGVEQLANPKGHVDLLADLVNEELSSESPPDAIIFIGPSSNHLDGFPRERIHAVPGRMPEFFYLHLDYYAFRFPWIGTIDRLTGGQGGEVFRIRSPEQFAKAIRRMEEILERAREATRDQGYGSTTAATFGANSS